jgi:hypothetical protein
METVITDAAGRRLTLRRVGVLETLRLYKALGPELSLNDCYVGLAKLAAAVASLDEIPIPFPVSEATVEAAIKRLGEDGIAAVEAVLFGETPDKVVADAGN